jgi:hypothetical protein
MAQYSAKMYKQIIIAHAKQLALDLLVCATKYLNHWFVQQQPQELLVCEIFSFSHEDLRLLAQGSLSGVTPALPLICCLVCGTADELWFAHL